jgi:hypothetical protein
MQKLNLLVFLVPLLLLSCAAPQADTVATVAPSDVVSAIVTTPVGVPQTAAPKLTPKHNDLIFVEFFAVT